VADLNPFPDGGRSGLGSTRRVSLFVEGLTGTDRTERFSDFLFHEALRSRSGQSSSPEAYDLDGVGKQAPLRSAKGIQDRHKHHDNGNAD
jgi:hypothetical protein